MRTVMPQMSQPSASSSARSTACSRESATRACAREAKRSGSAESGARRALKRAIDEKTVDAWSARGQAQWHLAQGHQAAHARVIKAWSVLGTTTSSVDHRDEGFKLESMA